MFDFLHRSGNVHDSHGAREFILACIQAAREALPGVLIEVRMDSAFFSDEIVMALEEARIEFTVSVPFERFMDLKRKGEARKRWQRFRGEVSYFQQWWKPKVWNRRFRFLFIRTRTKRQQKGPIQLDLFLPYEYGHDFRVVVTNKTLSPKKVVAFHEGRGSQEGILGELKSHCRMGYVLLTSPFRMLLEPHDSCDDEVSWLMKTFPMLAEWPNVKRLRRPKAGIHPTHNP